MTILADPMPASAGSLLFAADFSRWWTPFTTPLSRLQPDFHDSITANGSKSPVHGASPQSGLLGRSLQGRYHAPNHPIQFSPFQCADQSEPPKKKSKINSTPAQTVMLPGITIVFIRA